MINFAIIGAGWRTEFYIRIAKALPEQFHITGMYIRNADTAKTFREKYDLPIFDNLEDTLATPPDFVVSCVNKDGICGEIAMLCEKEVAVLSETPIGTSVDQINMFMDTAKPSWKVQVAEQFHFQPRNQAIKAVIDSGILGDVHQVQVSCCHDYHAVSLIRYFLDIGEKAPTVNSFSFPDKIVKYNGRNGVTEPQKAESKQTIALLDYGDKTALYDFTHEQYFSDIRATRITVRGTKGEIINDTCTYLDGTTPMHFSLSRNACGNNESLDGMYLDSITGNGKILYKNPFGKARLTDEEIAIAVCLVKMKDYVDTGKEFYSIRSAATDAWTALQF